MHRNLLFILALLLFTSLIKAQTVTFIINGVTTSNKPISELNSGDLENASSITLAGVWDQMAIERLKPALKPGNFIANGMLRTVNMSDITLTAPNLKELFLSFTGLEGITFPIAASNVETDFTSIFEGCTSLATLSNLTNFKKAVRFDHAFKDCVALQQITLPEGNGGINTSFTGTFTQCYNLTAINNLDKFTKVDSFRGTFIDCAALQQITLPEGNGGTPVNFYFAFSDCDNLTSIVNLDKFTNVSSFEGTFNNCEGLTAITLPAGNNGANIDFSWAFSRCKNLVTLTNLDKFTRMNNLGAAFQGCSAIETVTLPAGNGDMNIAFNGIFYNCTNLTTVNNLKEFKRVTDFSTAFVNCSSLGSITLPDGNGNMSISFDNAFALCSSLKAVDLSGFTKVTELESAFQGCTNLCTVKLGGTATQLTSSALAFLGTNPNCLVYVPTGWGNTNPWKDNPNHAYLLKENSPGSGQYTAMQSIVLTDELPFNSIYPAKMGEANTISYVRYMNSGTGVSGNNVYGWETICLPFVVATVKGTNKAGNTITLSPYMEDGNYAGRGTEGIVPFWLRTLNSSGYQTSLTINDTPQIISMQNAMAAQDKFNVSGNVTFTGAPNTDLLVTQPKSVAGPVYMMYSNYSTVPAAQDIYVADLFTGEAFQSNSHDALPFRPYVKAIGSSGAPDLFAINSGATSIEDIFYAEDGVTDKLHIYTSGDGLVIESPFVKEIQVHGIDGKIIRTVRLQEGTNYLSGLTCGVYLVEGVKVVM